MEEVTPKKVRKALYKQLNAGQDVIIEDTHFCERTQKGDLMLELNKFSAKSAGSFRGQVENVLSYQAEAKTRKQETTIERKDLSKVTSWEHICVALEIRKACGSTQAVIISLQVESVVKLITDGQDKDRMVRVLQMPR